MTPQRRARCRFVKQVAPPIEDLTGAVLVRRPQAGDYPTGAWGAESRDYHVVRAGEPGSGGEEMLAARVSLVVSGGDGQQVLGPGAGQGDVDRDEALSTRISRRSPHYTGQAELADAIQEGLEARKAGRRGQGHASSAGRWRWPHRPATRNRRALAKVVERGGPGHRDRAAQEEGAGRGRDGTRHQIDQAVRVTRVAVTAEQAAEQPAAERSPSGNAIQAEPPRTWTAELHQAVPRRGGRRRADEETLGRSVRDAGAACGRPTWRIPPS